MKREIVVVRRVTPTGRVALATGHAFMPDGREWGAISSGCCHWLEPFEFGKLPDGPLWQPMPEPPFPPPVY